MAIKTSLTTKRISYTVNKTDHVLNYDYDNLYPQRVKDIINDSSTGTLCRNKKSKFIMGGGFTDLDFCKAKINRKGMTADSLLRLISPDKATFKTLALQLNYNSLYEVTEVNFVHFDHCRLTDPEDQKYRGKIAVYNDWGKVKKKRIDFKDIDFIDHFDFNPEVIQAQVDALTQYDKDGETILVSGWSKYKGQILVPAWLDHWEYQLACCDSVLEDMQTQGKMKRFKKGSVSNNFLASKIAVTGEFESDEDRDAFQSNLKEFQGEENVGSIMHVEKSSPEDKVEFVDVTIQQYDGLYEYTETSCKADIIQNWEIPEILIMHKNTGFSQPEIEEATAFANGSTADDRLEIEEIFKMIFSRFHENVNPSGDYSILPYKSQQATEKINPELFPYLTKNEIRLSAGFGEALEDNADEQLLSEKLQVGGTTSLIQLLTDPILNDEQKIGTMEVLFGISYDNAKKMLGISLENANR